MASSPGLPSDHYQPVEVDATSLAALLTFAQQRSIRLGKLVTLCGFKKIAPNQCSEEGDISGWLVYVESNSSNYSIRSVLKRVSVERDFAVESLMRIERDRNRDDGVPEDALLSRAPVVVFQPNGRADRRGTLTFCRAKPSRDNSVVISPQGSGETSVVDTELCSDTRPRKNEA